MNICLLGNNNCDMDRENRCNKMVNICLYISSFVPLYLLVVIKTIIDILNGNLHFNITNTTLLILMLGLSIMGIIGVVCFVRYQDSDIENVTIVSCANTTDKHFLGYFSLFVLFALTFDLSMVSMSVVYILILILIGVVYIRNNLYSINPLLNILGYSCYQVVYRDSGGAEYSSQMFYKGRLSPARYKVAFKTCGMCLVVGRR